MDTRTRIEILKDLIAHPATNKHERANAQRILTRLLNPVQHPWQKRAAMAYAKKFVLIACLATSSSHACNVEGQLLRNSPQLSPTYAIPLAKAICNASAKHRIDAHLLAAILMQESSYKHGIRAGHDSGVGQINDSVAYYYALNTERLRIDLDYAVDSTAMILRDLKNRHGGRGKWWTYYHSARRDLQSKYAMAVERWK